MQGTGGAELSIPAMQGTGGAESSTPAATLLVGPSRPSPSPQGAGGSMQGTGGAELSIPAALQGQPPSDSSLFEVASTVVNVFNVTSKEKEPDQQPESKKNESSQKRKNKSTTNESSQGKRKKKKQEEEEKKEEELWHLYALGVDCQGKKCRPWGGDKKTSCQKPPFAVWASNKDNFWYMCKECAKP
jgi:hypothetical protein